VSPLSTQIWVVFLLNQMHWRCCPVPHPANINHNHHSSHLQRKQVCIQCIMYRVQFIHIWTAHPLPPIPPMPTSSSYLLDELQLLGTPYKHPYPTGSPSKPLTKPTAMSNIHHSPSRSLTRPINCSPFKSPKKPTGMLDCLDEN